MSETPLPQLLTDTPDERTGTGEFRARRRASSSASRAVSAFAPGQSTPRPEPASSSSSPTEGDIAFVAALHAAGVIGELQEGELKRVAELARRDDEQARRTDLLAAYYEASGNALAAQRRQATDRWFLFRAEDGLSASQLVAQLLNVVPELSGAELERVGGADGTLVLRAGEDICALEDEQQQEAGTSTVSVRDLVRAINVLLDRRLVRARLVGLFGDGEREAYLGLPSVTAAIPLVSANLLAATDAEALLDLTGW